MNWIFENVDVLLPSVQLLLSLVVALIFFFVKKDASRIKNILGDDKMKFRSPDAVIAQSQSKETAPSQDFTSARYKPVYRLNKSTGELELTDDVVDLQEMLDSAKDYCLQACLERFLINQETPEDEVIQDYDAMLDDLDNLNVLYNAAEDYKERFNLDPALTVEQVFERVQKEADALKARLDKNNTGGKTDGQVSQEKKDASDPQK